MERFVAHRREEVPSSRMQELVNELMEATGDAVSMTCVDGTCEIESDRFTLTFTHADGIFEIRSIDVRGNSGLGRVIIAAIHNYADAHGLDVIASNVLDTAQGFWERMGYRAGSTDGEYFRVE